VSITGRFWVSTEDLWDNHEENDVSDYRQGVVLPRMVGRLLWGETRSMKYLFAWILGVSGVADFYLVYMNHC